MRKSLRSHWQAEVVLAYGLLPGDDFQPRLETAEHWLQKHPGDSALLLTLGRLCLRQQVWGKAQEYFEASVKAGAGREAYGELARLLSHLGKHSLSQQAYQQALQLDAANLPELPQPKPIQAR